MKKFLLVTLIGMVLVMDLCGLVKDFIESNKEIEEVDPSWTVVYVE